MGKNTDKRRWIMENKMRRNILIAAAVLTAAAVIILTVIGLAAENRDYEPASWVLKAYGNSVALYNDGKISDVFGEISLNELPEEDVRILQNGIAFPTRDEAVQAIEDYE